MRRLEIPLRTLMLANAALAVLFGLGFALAPEWMLELLPFFNPWGQLRGALGLIRIFGILLFGAGLALWILPDFEVEGARRRLLLGIFAGLGLIWIFLPLISRSGKWVESISVAIALFYALAVRVSITAALVVAARSLTRKPRRQEELERVRESGAREERNRIARDLHDSIKQQLFSISLSSAAAEERLERDPRGARSALVDVRRSAQEAMVEMRAMLSQLRPEPLATAGLVEALREQCEALGYRSGIPVQLEIGDLPPDDRLPPGTQENLFKIAQEALSNVARHARARTVQVRLGRIEEDGLEALLLVVRDDGQGFDPATQPSGMGLRSLRERLAEIWGTVKIESAPGQGTELRIYVPLTLAAGLDTSQIVRGAGTYTLFPALLAIITNPLNILAAGFAIASAALLGVGLFSAAWHVGSHTARGMYLSLLGQQQRFFLLALAFWWTCPRLLGGDLSDAPWPRTAQATRFVAWLALALALLELGRFLLRRRRLSPEAGTPPVPLLNPWVFGAIACLFLASIPALLWADPQTVGLVGLKSAGFLYVGWWMRELP